jgi:hypothetical protein
MHNVLGVALQAVAFAFRLEIGRDAVLLGLHLILGQRRPCRPANPSAAATAIANHSPV